MVESRLENGIIYCRISRDAITEVQDVTFDLLNDRHHLLLASGSAAFANSVGMHDIDAATSAEALLLTEISVVHARSQILMLLHGTFMVVAWIGLASIGMFTARFYKKTWVGSKIAGKDWWFVVHQVTMVLTLLLSIAAFIIIFVDVGTWRTSTHSVLGTISFALMLIQPIMAAFRPAPKSDNRPIFNFMHMTIGNASHLLAGKETFIGNRIADFIHSIRSHHNHVLCGHCANAAARLDALDCDCVFRLLRDFVCFAYGE